MIDVVAGILLNEDNKIFIARRKKGKHLEGYWEFPGGKIEEGETPEQSLIRELREELQVEVKVIDYVGESIYRYKDKSVKLLGYTGEIIEGDISLKDHDAYEWVSKGVIKTYKLAPADIPLIERIGSYLLR